MTESLGGNVIALSSSKRMIRQSYQRAPRQDRAPVSRSLAGQRFGPANRNPIITRDQPASARTHMPVSRMRASCAFVIDRGLRREPCRKKTVRALISAERAGNVAGATVRCGGQALRRPRSPCPPPAPRTASIKLDAGLASGSGRSVAATRLRQAALAEITATPGWLWK
jgi:hypothetical protein